MSTTPMPRDPASPPPAATTSLGTPPSDARSAPEIGDLMPTPRDLRIPRRVRVLRALFLLAIVVPPVLLEVGGRMEAADARALMERGRVVDAEVTGKHVRRGRSTDHFVDAVFRFDGRTWEVCERVSFARFDTATAGDATEVTFLPERPDRAVLGRVDEARVGRALAAARVAGVILGLSFLCVLAGFEASLRRGRRLLRDGRAATARIVHVHAPVGRGVAGARVDYCFEDDEGREVVGKSFLRPTAPPDLAPGTTAVVLYDPSRPRRNVLLRATARVAELAPAPSSGRA